jgi:hypothetical protein
MARSRWAIGFHYGCGEDGVREDFAKLWSPRSRFTRGGIQGGARPPGLTGTHLNRENEEQAGMPASREAASRQQLVHILREHVGFQIHRLADFRAVKMGLLPGVRGDPEDRTVRGELGDG